MSDPQPGQPDPISVIVAVGRELAENLMGIVLPPLIDMITYGVTNIKRWENRTDLDLEVWKIDGGGETDRYFVAAGSSRNGDMWVPWADNADQYASKHATIQVGGQPLAYLWQNGRAVRFNTADTFVDDGTPAPGYARSGGERKLVVDRAPSGQPVFTLTTL